MGIQTDDLGEPADAPRAVGAARQSPQEEALERALRPRQLRDYVGQAKLPSRVQALKALQISRSLQFFDYGFELAAFFGAHGVLKKHESDVLTNSSFWTTGSSRQQRPRRTAKLIRLLPGAVQKRLRWALEEISRAAD